MAKNLLEMTDEELKAKYGVDVQHGKIAVVKNRYCLTIGRKQTVLDPSLLIAPKPIEKLVGKPVEARIISSRGKIIIIIVVVARVPCYHILCYVPVPDLRYRIDKDVRLDIVDKMAAAKILPADLAKQVEVDIRAGF